MTTSRPLELLHMDLFGPVAYLSIGGSKYGLVIFDDFSRFTWVLFLQDKSKIQGTLKRFLKRAQNEFELKVKKIRSDNGSEFKNLQVEEYLEKEGVKHEFSAPYTPQQNGVVERKIKTLTDMARMMLGEFKTPKRFWSEAVNTACHAINRLYLHRLLKKTSYELLTGNKPNVSYFRVFGSKCYILVKKGRHFPILLRARLPWHRITRVIFYILLIILSTRLGEFMLRRLTLFPIMLLCIRVRLLALGILPMLKCLKRNLMLHQMIQMFHLILLMHLMF
jgi:transposase InsO family protein